MRKVLIITYNFPPDGGPAVQRALKFAKYLREYGYQPIVLTSKHKLKKIDKDLLNEIPDDLVVYKTRDVISFIPGEIRNLALKLFLPMDNKYFWQKSSFKTAKKIVERHNIDIVFSTSPPHSVHILASRLKREFGLPWVADFRDEWSQDPRFCGNEKTLKLEERLLKYCDKMVCVTDKARANFNAIAGKDKCSTIRNGFDPMDFDGANTDIEFDKSKMNIVYAGRFTVKSSPRILFEELDKALESDPSLKSKFHIHVFGKMKSGGDKWLSNLNAAKEAVTNYPYVPHSECCAILKKADVLLLLSSNLEGGTIIPGKAYEYFYTRKPIFAIESHKSELTDLLEEYGASYVCWESNRESIMREFKKALGYFSPHNLNKTINYDFINQFNRKEQAKSLAGVFDELLNKEAK